MENNNQPASPQSTDQQIQQPTVPSSNFPKFKLPLFILIAFLFLILVGSGVYYFAKISNLKTQISNPQLKSQNLRPTQAILSPIPSIDETANWKTYTNTFWKISFKYPPRWETVENQFESGMLIRTSDLQMKDYSNVQKGAFLYGPYVPGVLPYSWDKVFEGYTNERVEILNEQLSVDNQLTKIGIIRKQNSSQMIVYYKYPKAWKDEYNSTIQLSFINLVSTSKEFETAKKEFYQILSTFKFTDE